MTQYTSFELCPTITDGCARINEHDENMVKTTEAMISSSTLKYTSKRKQHKTKLNENKYIQPCCVEGNVKI